MIWYDDLHFVSDECDADLFSVPDVAVAVAVPNVK